MSTLSFELAKSNRSTCKACKSTINKDEVRVGTHINYNDRDMCQWRHLDCFKVTKTWEFIDVKNVDGYDDLSIDNQKLCVKHWQDYKKKDNKTDKKKSKKNNKNKASSDSQSEDDEESNDKYDKKKIRGYTQKQFEKYQKLLIELNQFSTVNLKSELKRNLQKQSGNKQELIERIADGRVLGQIPICSACGGGRPRFDFKLGTYKCPGYMEDTTYVNCGVKFTLDEINREKWLEKDDDDDNDD